MYERAGLRWTQIVYGVTLKLTDSPTNQHMIDGRRARWSTRPLPYSHRSQHHHFNARHTSHTPWRSTGAGRSHPAGPLHSLPGPGDARPCAGSNVRWAQRRPLRGPPAPIPPGEARRLRGHKVADGLCQRMAGQATVAGKQPDGHSHSVTAISHLFLGFSRCLYDST